LELREQSGGGGRREGGRGRNDRGGDRGGDRRGGDRRGSSDRFGGGDRRGSGDRRGGSDSRGTDSRGGDNRGSGDRRGGYNSGGYNSSRSDSPSRGGRTGGSGYSSDRPGSKPAFSSSPKKSAPRRSEEFSAPKKEGKLDLSAELKNIFEMDKKELRKLEKKRKGN